MAIKNVLVIGNRDLSYTIVGALAEASSDSNAAFNVSVLTYPSQSPYLPPSISSSIVNHKTSDFSDASLQSAFTGQDLVISTVAAGDYSFQVRIIDAVIAAGVKRFIPNEFGQDSLNTRIQNRMPQSAERAKVIEYIRRISNTQTHFQHVAVATGCILDTILPTGDLGFDMEWRSASIHGTGHEFFAASSLGRVGLVVASIVEHWNEVKNRYIYAAGTLTTAQSILGCLERHSESSWTVDYSDVSDCVREGNTRLERGFPDSGMFLLGKSVLFDEDLRAVDAFHDRSANSLLQLEPENVDEIVGEAYHRFKHRGKAGCGCN